MELCQSWQNWFGVSLWAGGKHLNTVLKIKSGLNESVKFIATLATVIYIAAFSAFVPLNSCLDKCIFTHVSAEINVIAQTL